MTEAHDLPKGMMLFCQVLQFAVVQFANLPDGGYHENLPIVKSPPLHWPIDHGIRRS